VEAIAGAAVAAVLASSRLAGVMPETKEDDRTEGIFERHVARQNALPLGCVPHHVMLPWPLAVPSGRHAARAQGAGGILSKRWRSPPACTQGWALPQ
jgi:hypothetical protein